ncbi:MAG: hypothetical protein AAF639_00955, partial [Chloroflexota bacterium]
ESSSAAEVRMPQAHLVPYPPPAHLRLTSDAAPPAKAAVTSLPPPRSVMGNILEEEAEGVTKPTPF